MTNETTKLPTFTNADGNICHKSGGICEMSEKLFERLFKRLDSPAGTFRFMDGKGLPDGLDVFTLDPELKTVRAGMVLVKVRRWGLSPTLPGIPELGEYPKVTVEQMVNG